MDRPTALRSPPPPRLAAKYASRAIPRHEVRRWRRKCTDKQEDERETLLRLSLVEKMINMWVVQTAPFWTIFPSCRASNLYYNFYAGSSYFHKFISCANKFLSFFSRFGFSSNDSSNLNFLDAVEPSSSLKLKFPIFKSSLPRFP